VRTTKLCAGERVAYEALVIIVGCCFDRGVIGRIAVGNLLYGLQFDPCLARPFRHCLHEGYRSGGGEVGLGERRNMVFSGTAVDGTPPSKRCWHVTTQT
jgi:hypothetical protein